MAAFALQLPAWCGPDGLPLSWRHGVYGMGHLARAHVRRQHEVAEAVRMGQNMNAEDWSTYQSTVRRTTEVPPNG
jgi:hypothetical protein